MTHLFGPIAPLPGAGAPLLVWILFSLLGYMRLLRRVTCRGFPPLSVDHLFTLPTVSFAVCQLFSLLSCCLFKNLYLVLDKILLCRLSWPSTHDDPLHPCLPSTESSNRSSLSVIPLQKTTLLRMEQLYPLYV